MNTKHFLKRMKFKFKKLMHKKDTLIIAAIILLTFVMGIMTMGFSKTITLLIFIIILLFVLKLGVKLIRSQGKGNISSKKKKSFWRKFILLCMTLAVAIIFALICFFIYIVIKAPEFNPANLYNKESSTVYDKDGNVIAKIGSQIRETVTYDQLPEVFVNAIVATEDSRFFQHNGFDLARFIKASAGQALGQSSAGGASTITMQVSKNSLTSTDISVVRKFTDIYLAVFKIEKKYTKQQILEFYVNSPYLGNGSYGVEEAAKNYFGKDISDLNLSESALLAGLFQAPGAYDPYLHPAAATARRTIVLKLMLRHGYITQEEYDIANAIPVSSLLISKSSSSDQYQGYIDTVLKEVEDKTGYSPYNVTMKIYTAMDTNIQNYVNNFLNGTLYTYKDNAIQAAVAVTDTNTGAVVAIGNGRNRSGERIYNYVTDMRRQIGSTAKIIFEYGPGIEFNNWSPGKLLLDDAYTYSDGTVINDSDNTYLGLLTMRDALAHSRNIPALKALQELIADGETSKVISFIKSLGITPDVNSNGTLNESEAIGAFSGASPLQMAVAYAAYGNGGYYIKPYTVTKIVFTNDDKTKTYNYTKTQVMSDSTAFMVTDMLRYAVDNGYMAGKVSGVQVAAKTGTTNLDDATEKAKGLPSNTVQDLWEVGYSPSYSIAMWYGYEEISKEHYMTTAEWGTRTKLFNLLASGIFPNSSKKTFDVPSSVSKVTIEQDTDPIMLPSAYTPSSMITTEYFKTGTEPTDVSPRYDKLSSPTGLKVEKSGSNLTISWNKVSANSYVTDDYKKMLGPQVNEYLAVRTASDLSILGNIGYNVYLKSSSGSLTKLEYTSNTSYTYTPTSNGSLTFVVKACYSNYSSNQSDGAEFTYSYSGNISVPDISLKGNSTVNVALNGTYTDAGIVVLDNGIDMTTSATVTKTYTKDSVTATGVDPTVAGTYVITYHITYNTTNKTLTRTVIVGS